MQGHIALLQVCELVKKWHYVCLEPTEDTKMVRPTLKRTYNSVFFCAREKPRVETKQEALNHPVV